MFFRSVIAPLGFWMISLAMPSLTHAELQGDPQATALAAEMVEALGGREAWANARWLYTAERSFHENYKLALDYQGWRDLGEPRGWNRVDSSELSYEQGWTKGQGWRLRNGEFQAFSDDRLNSEVSFWPREIYIMYHRFANGDARLKLTSTGERSFSVENAETGTALGEFKISKEGGPLVWSSGDGEDDVTYVYGPLAEFDGVSLPAWGAQLDGSWRFNYVAARLTNEAPEVTFEPPEQFRN